MKKAKFSLILMSLLAMPITLTGCKKNNANEFDFEVLDKLMPNLLSEPEKGNQITFDNAKAIYESFGDCPEYHELNYVRHQTHDEVRNENKTVLYKDYELFSREKAYGVNIYTYPTFDYYGYTSGDEEANATYTASQLLFAKDAKLYGLAHRTDSEGWTAYKSVSDWDGESYVSIAGHNKDTRTDLAAASFTTNFGLYPLVRYQNGTDLSQMYEYFQITTDYFSKNASNLYVEINISPKDPNTTRYFYCHYMRYYSSYKRASIRIVYDDKKLSYVSINASGTRQISSEDPETTIQERYTEAYNYEEFKPVYPNMKLFKYPF